MHPAPTLFFVPHLINIFSYCSVFCPLSYQAGLVFAKPMRELNCVTMLHPFHAKYGNVVTAGLSLATVCMDVIWIPAILIGLGTYA